MKKITFLSFITLLPFNNVNTQTLYSENFDNLAIGSVSTDLTGQTSGKGGWYTYYSGPNPNLAHFDILPELGRGNILKLPSISMEGYDQCVVFRNDLLPYWKQRQIGNNILKISFDFYTGDAGNFVGGNEVDISRIDIVNTEGDHIIGYQFSANTNTQHIRASHPFERDNNYPTIPYSFSSNNYAYAMPKDVILPTNQWVTLELYIDYISNKLYFGIPSLNYTIVRNSEIQLGLGNEGHDDSPTMIIFKHAGHEFTKDYFPKFDNIKISAQNTIPTVSVNEVLSEIFNLFPNPVNNIVNITNSENMTVQEVIVYDINGKQLKTQNFDSSQEIKLNVENLESGTYMLHIKSDSGTAVKKLIKK